MQPQGGWKSVRLVKIEGSNHLPDVLPKLFPRITFSHDGLGQTLSPIAAVGFLGYFEDEFSHAPNSNLPMPERQVQAWQMSPDALVGHEKVNFWQNASSAQKIG
jgi:hypothetical protein